jgi:putative redox protein
MTTDAIARAMAAARHYLERHPEPLADVPVVATLEGGLRVRAATADRWSVTTDMPPEVGGAGSGPTPGTLLRAALATCDVTTVAMCAAEAGIELTRAEATVESTSDYRGLLAGGGVAPGPLEITVRYRLEAAGAGAARLHELLRVAEARSPVADALRGARTPRVELATDPAGEAESSASGG